MKVIDQKIAENYSIYHADTVEVAYGLPDNSVHFSVFSPPFETLFTYSNSDRDMGNSRTSTEFWDHYKFLIREQFRVIKPGRLVAIHCMNLPPINLHNAPRLTPCVGLCKMEGGQCQGCWRTLDEIRRWKDMTREEREEVMKKISERC